MDSVMGMGLDLKMDVAMDKEFIITNGDGAGFYDE